MLIVSASGMFNPLTEPADFDKRMRKKDKKGEFRVLAT
jgi:hypothetical protein